MRLLTLFFLIIFGFFGLAQAELVSKTIEYQDGETVLEGYLVYDTDFTALRPGVLVVHEWKGLNDYAKMRSDMLAKMGYVAFAADIYGKGIRPQTVEEAGAQAGKYKNDRTLLRQRVHAGLLQLKSQANVDARRVAAIGYCFGGTAVLELARLGDDVAGVVSFHGGLNTPTPEDAKNIKARILVLHGAADPFVPEEEVTGFEKEMTDANVPYFLIKYPSAVHGFTNPANTGELKGAMYDSQADQKSWSVMQEFFNEIFK